MKKIKPKHITNITYQDFDDSVFYYITYPGVKQNLYGINTSGDVISLVKNREKLRKPDFDRRGYFRISLRSIENKKIAIMVSRLVAWEFVGKPENYKELEVNHADGDIIHNYYKNLEWVTSFENSIHKIIYRLAAQSESHGWNTHPEKVVRRVIKLMNEGMSASDIAINILVKYNKIYDATKYNYDRLRGLVSKIKNKNSWYNLENDIKGSTTIERIIYEKHIGEEVSRVGLKPILIRNGGHFITSKRE